jgi:FkbM family methyltransferase
MIGKTISRILTRYYRGPNHPMKLRLWRYARQFSGYAPLTIAYGERAWITIDERDWLQSSIFASGAYEPEVWAALARFASGGEEIWDVGANIGSFALTAAQDHRVRCVRAFEPDPLTLATLKTNLALNGNPAVVYAFALSDRAERKTLIHGPRTNTGMSTLSPTADTGMTRHVSARDSLPTFEVECRTADELIAHGDVPPPTLMKIDVEGWEFQVLNGAHHLLQSTRLKAIVFEAAPGGTTGTLRDDRLGHLLMDYGYSICHIPRPDGAMRGVENYVAALH